MRNILLPKFLLIAFVFGAAATAHAQSALTLTTWSNIPRYEVGDQNLYGSGDAMAAAITYAAGTAPDDVTTVSALPAAFSQSIAPNSAIRLSGFLNVVTTGEYWVYEYSGTGRIAIDGNVLDNAENYIGNGGFNASVHLSAGTHSFDAFSLYSSAYQIDPMDGLEHTVETIGDGGFSVTIYEDLTQLGIDGTFSPSAASVPEPASWAMFIGGFGLIGGAIRCKKVAIRFA